MNKLKISTGPCLVLLMVLLLCASALGVNYSPIRVQTDNELAPIPAFQGGGERDDYYATLRLYMVQPTYIWKDYYGHPYEFGFLEFAMDSVVMIPDTARFYRSIHWTYGTIAEDNIMVIGALFNSTPHQSYSVPPSGYPFWAYYVDAAAGATPGMSDTNNTTPTSTHTVMVEEGTSTT